MQSLFAKSSRVVALAAASTLWLGLASAPAAGGGLYINEFATPSDGNAGVGRGAWGDGASALLHNPATMNRLDDHAFSTGFSAVYGGIRFDPASNTPTGGGGGGNQAGFAPLSSLNYVHRIDEKLRFGLTVFSLSGSALDPDSDWAGRREVTELSLLTLSISPALSYKVNDWLTVGAGPIITYGRLDWKLRSPVPPAGEQEIDLDKLDDWQPAARVGVLIEPREDVSLSIRYISETDFSLSGDIDIPVGLTADLDLDLPLAQLVEVSARWQATDWLELLGTFNWEDWSTADKLDVNVGGLQISPTTGFKDTYKFGLGANIQVKEDWLLQTGVMFDTSALDSDDRTTALPIDEQIRAAIGFRYDLSPDKTLGMSLVYVNLGRGRVDTASVRGDYSTNDLFVLGVTLDFKKLWWSGRYTR